MANEPITMADLPDDVINFLVGEEGFDFARSFVNKYGIEKDKVSTVLALVQDVVTRYTQLESLPDEMVSRLGVSQDKAKAAAAELAGKRLLPIAGVIGDVSSYIVKWGGDLTAAKAGAEAIVPLLTVEHFAQGFLPEHGFLMQTPNLQNRLELALSTYLKRERDGKHTRELLVRDIKVGGLEMGEDEANGLLMEVEKTILELQLKFEDVKEVEVVKEKPQEIKVVQEPKTTPTPLAPKKKVKILNELPKRILNPVAPAKSVDSLRAEPLKKEIPEPQRPKFTVKPKAKPELSAGQPPLTPPWEVGESLPPPLKTFPSTKISMDDLKGGGSPVVAPVKKDSPVEITKKAPRVPVTPPSPPLKSGGSTTSAKLDVFDDEDEKEIAAIKSKIQEFKIGSKPFLNIDEAVDRIRRETHLTFTDLDLKKRYEKTIESRLRGVRNAYETRDQLESSPEHGGIGLTGVKLAEASAVIERIVGEYQSAVSKKMAKEKRARLDQLRKERSAREQKLKDKESQFLSKRYAEITGSAPKQSISPAAPTGARISASASAEQQLKRQEAQIDTEKVKQAAMGTKTRPGSVTPKYSAQTLHKAGRPKVQDVQFTRRLAGPVEELRLIDVTDFRRLSTNPTEAATKVNDTIDLLAQDGFEKKIEGIKAWRESPINKLYLSITQEAFLAAKSIDEVLAQRKEAEKETLEKADIDAIMELNAKLRF